MHKYNVTSPNQFKYNMTSPNQFKYNGLGETTLYYSQAWNFSQIHNCGCPQSRRCHCQIQIAFSTPKFFLRPNGRTKRQLSSFLQPSKFFFALTGEILFNNDHHMLRPDTVGNRLVSCPISCPTNIYNNCGTLISRAVSKIKIDWI